MVLQECGMRFAVPALFVVLLLATSPAATAQPGGRPPKLDVAAATAALKANPIYRAPGAVARFDEARVRAELTDDVRVLVAPYTGEFAKGNNYATSDEHYDQVYTPLNEWAAGNKLKLIKIEGLYITMTGGPGIGPSDIAELRQYTAYRDVTASVLALARLAKGMPADQARLVDYEPDKVVAPTAAQVAALAERLRQSPIHNDPARDDKVTLSPDLIRDRAGFSVRIAALPVPERGQPVIDYAPALGKFFPNDVVMVATGGWLDIAAPEQDKAESARNYAFGRFEIGSFQKGGTIDGRISSVLLRLQTLVKEKPFGRPLPEAFDLRKKISDLAPWVLLGSAVVIACASYAAHRIRKARRVEADELALRLATADTHAEITSLGEALLESPNADAAERYATAKTLFDQAHTAPAMHEVAAVAKAGQRMLAKEGA
jgi:hypothetical protein